MAYVALKGVCSKKKKGIQVQFKEEPGVYTAVGNCLDVGGGGAEGSRDIKGSMLMGDRYPGCPICGMKHLYMCKHCGKLICYDGKAGTEKCPSCGKTEPVPQAQGNKIMMSGAVASANPAKVLLFIDSSGSMGCGVGSAFENAKNAAINEFIRKLPAGSQLAVGSFGDRVTLWQPLTADRNVLERAVRSIPDEGGTTGPLTYVLNEQQYASCITGKNCYVVVLTDGCWSYSDQNIEAAKALKKKGVTIIAMGFGGVNQTFLDAISTPGGTIKAGASANEMNAAFASAAKMITQ
ncbi:MAG: VWA domain-containing protein [Clostridia bacterium]|nr:VWA domain-containing protein [Clostridia bacterium]